MSVRPSKPIISMLSVRLSRFFGVVGVTTTTCLPRTNGSQLRKGTTLIVTLMLSMLVRHKQTNPRRTRKAPRGIGGLQRLVSTNTPSGTPRPNSPKIVLRLRRRTIRFILNRRLLFTYFHVRVRTTRLISMRRPSVPTRSTLLRSRQAKTFRLRQGNRRHGSKSTSSAPRSTTRSVRNPFRRLVPRLRFRHTRHRGVTTHATTRFPTSARYANLVTTNFFSPIRRQRTRVSHRARTLRLLRVKRRILLALLHRVRVRFVRHYLPRPIRRVVRIHLSLRPVSLDIGLLQNDFRGNGAYRTLKPILFRLFRGKTYILLHDRRSRGTLGPLNVAKTRRRLFRSDVDTHRRGSVSSKRGRRGVTKIRRKDLNRHRANHVGRNRRGVGPRHGFGFASQDTIRSVLTLVGYGGDRGVNRRRWGANFCRVIRLRISRLIRGAYNRPPHRPGTRGRERRVGRGRMSVLRFFAFHGRAISLSPFVFAVLSCQRGNYGE